MSSVPADTRAWRREMVAGCLGFLVGFAAVAAGIILLYLRVVIPEQGWWGVVDCILRLLTYPILGGAAVAAVLVVPLNRWHYYRGVYRCYLCGRRLRKGVQCECLPEEFRRQPRRPSRWRHYRRRIKSVLMTYAAVSPVVIPLAVSLHRRHGDPLIVDLMMGYAAASFAIFLVMDLVTEILQMLGRGKRMRKRWPVFGLMLVWWIPLFAFAMAFLTWIGGR